MAKATTATTATTEQTDTDGLGYDHKQEFDFMSNWDSVKYGGRSAAEKYVEQEVDKAVANGFPVLRVILNLEDENAQEACLNYLRSTGTANMVGLRLAPGVDADIPTYDAHGLPLPVEKQGKVLSAYLGPLGGNIPNAHKQPASVTDKFTGTRRSAAMKRLLATGNKEFTIYRQVEISAKPVLVSFSDAVSVLRKWGYGAGPENIIFTMSATQAQNRWLVVEVPSMMS